MWKKLLDHLKGIAPMVVGAAGTAAGGPLVGGVLANVARSITGKGDLDDAAGAIFGDPDLMVKMEQLAVEREKNEQDAEIRRLELASKQQEMVNLTMQAEAKADDKWTRRWRPYFGYVAATAFGLQIVGVVYIMVTGGDPELIARVVSLTPIWTPALAVLGVTSWGRSQEKTARIKNGHSK
jgi:hypothetical protein